MGRFAAVSVPLSLRCVPCECSRLVRLCPVSDQDGRSPFITAVEEGHKPIIEWLKYYYRKEVGACKVPTVLPGRLSYPLCWECLALRACPSPKLKDWRMCPPPYPP